MPLKLDEHGKVVTEESTGFPIWVNNSGQEEPINYEALTARISEVNRESKGRKETIHKYEEQFIKPFKDRGIEDVSAFIDEANKAMELASSMSEKDKATQDEIKAQILANSKQWEDKLIKAEEEKRQLQAQWETEAIKNGFSTSPFVRERTISPVIVQQLLSPYFRLVNGKLVGHDPNSGTPILGPNGEPANTCEAVATLLKANPEYAHLMKGAEASGSGAPPSGAMHTNHNNLPKSLADCKSQAEEVAYLERVAKVGQ